MLNISVTEAEYFDMDELILLYKKYLKEMALYNKEFKKDIEKARNKDAFLTEAAQGEVAEALFSKNHILYQVRARNNSLIGFAIIGLYPHSFDNQSYYIQEFFIDKDIRRRGIGIKAVELIHKKMNMSNINLIIIRSNKKARAFWERCFKKLGLQNVGGKNGYKLNKETERLYNFVPDEDIFFYGIPA